MPYGFIFKVKALIFSIFLFSQSLAWAQCAAPIAPEGTREWFPADNIYKLCNGTDWVPFHLAGTPRAACSQTAAMDFDTDLNQYKFCDGTVWQPIVCETPGGGKAKWVYAGHTHGLDDEGRVWLWWPDSPTYEHFGQSNIAVTCGLRANPGFAYCWGSDYRGSLGAAPEYDCTDLICKVGSGTGTPWDDWIFVMPSVTSTGFGIRADGSAWGWGDSSTGLGDGLDHGGVPYMPPTQWPEHDGTGDDTAPCPPLGNCSAARTIDYLSGDKALAWCDGTYWRIMAQ